MLQSVCRYCYQLRLSAVVTKLYAAKFQLIRAGLLMEASAIDSIIDVKPRKKDSDEENEEETNVVDINEKDSIMAKIDAYVQEALSKNVGRCKKV